jgi:Ca2+-binding RTX toxin-like protein
VRSEETNLGNLTADANLAFARSVDPTVMVSLKNGGGIRNSIGQSLIPTGSVDGVPELLPTAAVFDAQGNVVKPEGGISRNDIANALSFNNGLSLVSVTPAELKALIEFGLEAGVGGGRFPQVGGMAFSYDLSRPAGERVLNLTIEDQSGNDLDVVVRGGAVVGDPNRTIRMVTLDFLANGGDGYPFASLASPNRIDLTASATAPRTGVATFAANGSEQDALAEYLAANYSPAAPFGEADTAQLLDTRLQNLAVRSDAVIDPVRVGTSGDDTTLPGASTIPGFDGRLDTVFTGAGDDEIDVALTGGGDNTIFTGSGANIVYAGSRDVITGGNDSDQIWAIAGDGNRLSGLGGDDDFVIGSAGNRVLGGDGNDVFTVLGGAGTNYLNGGAGSDQFWLVSGPGDLPAAQQVVMDFSAGVDKVGLRGAFTDLSFSQMGANTMLSLGGNTIGQFTNVSAATLNNQANFVFAWF